MVATTEVGIHRYDGRQEFRDGLREMRSAFRSERQFIDASRVSRLLRRPGLFDKVYNHAIDEASKALALSSRADEFADGDFGKWFFEWLSNGGWEIIIEFIKALLALS